MPTLETDYLIIGAGAVGLAFADVMLEQDPDAHLTIVDKHAKPGGHWNDAYPFVALHQPSNAYGLNSLELGMNRIDEAGPNKGFFELASGAEVSAYFDNAMRDHLLPSGRVTYHPLTEYLEGADGEHTVRGILSGKRTTIRTRRKIVDSTWFNTSVPSTHTRQFEVADDVRVSTPGDLTTLWKSPDAVPGHYVLLGAGKTAMDAGVWLVEVAGIDPNRITWVRPRDSWCINRETVQPGEQFFDRVIAGQTRIFEAAADAETAQDIFLKLEETGEMLRIDPDTVPTMFHYPTISTGEIDRLRRITDVVRKGRVKRLEPGRMILAEGEVEVPGDALYIDCTASAVRPKPVHPQFQGDKITPQLLHVPLVTLNASITAWLEANLDTDEEKNAMGEPVPFLDSIDGYPVTLLGTGMNRFKWSQNPDLSAWMANSRLDPAARTVAGLKRDNPAALAPVPAMMAASMKALPNLQRLAKLAVEG